MKRRVYSVTIAAMLAGASLSSALPTFAQATNSDGYQVYTQNYDGTVMTPTGSGTTGAAVKATVMAGQSVTLYGPRSANYDDATQSAHSTVTTAGSTQMVGTATTGMTTFTNVANSGNQAANVAWQYTPTTAGPGLEGYTTATSVNQSPIVDLASLVSFNMYVESSAPVSTVDVEIELEENTTAYYNADSASGTTSTAIPNTGTLAGNVAAQPDILGMRGTDGPYTDIWIDNVGSTTTASGFPTGGIAVTSGHWQTVTFNLATDVEAALLTAGPGEQRSGLGRLYGMDFTPVTPGTNQSYSVYIDDLTIGAAAAPEPSEWAAMGLGAAGLLGLALRARRRSATPTAV